MCLFVSIVFIGWQHTIGTCLAGIRSVLTRCAKEIGFGAGDRNTAADFVNCDTVNRPYQRVLYLQNVISGRGSTPLIVLP